MASIEENSTTKDDSVKATEAPALAIRTSRSGFPESFIALPGFKVGLACYTTGISQLAHERSPSFDPIQIGRTQKLLGRR
jgi:hypothetical protein